MVEFEFITKRDELKILVHRLENSPVVGVDMEADSMYHFKEKVCLLQIGTHDINAVIDVLQVHDLSVLAPVFENYDIKKILHGADYDIRSLYRDFNLNINNLFDTQIAGCFVGMSSTGLAAMVAQILNVNLDKKFQKKDWSKRPLPPAMLEYAARDIVYLIPLANFLEEKLKIKDRLQWVIEECQLLSKVRYNNNLSQEPLYLKFKGAGHLPSRKLAVLEDLLQYRLRVADKKDRPPFKIMGNLSIMEMARQTPQTLTKLEKAKILSPLQIQMYGKYLINVIKTALNKPSEQLPIYRSKRTPVLPRRTSDRIKALKDWRLIKAEGLGLDPALLCSKNALVAIAINNPAKFEELKSVSELKKWQLAAFGGEIIVALEKINLKWQR